MTDYAGTTEMCGYCGKTDNLVEFDEEMYCYGFCLDEAKRSAEINERDKVLEERRLWK